MQRRRSNSPTSIRPRLESVSSDDDDDDASSPVKRRRRAQSLSTERLRYKVNKDDDEQLEELEGYTIEPPTLPTDYYTLERDPIRKWRGGVVSSRTYRIRIIKPLSRHKEHPTWVQLYNILLSAFSKILINTSKNAFVQLKAIHPYITGGARSTHRVNAKDLTFFNFAERMARVIQSARNMKLSDVTWELLVTDPLGS